MAEFASVSVVIPCYRCAGTISRAVASIDAQTLKPEEVILVDDYSEDGTLDTLYVLQAQYPAGWIKVIELHRNVGPGEARNAGWERALYGYIAFLDADDSWHPQKIEIQYRWMKAHPQAALTGHACKQLTDDALCRAEPAFSMETVEFHPITRAKLLLNNRFPTRSVMLRRDLRQRFSAGKRHSEDYLLWLEIVCSGLSAWRFDLPLAYLHKAPFGEGGLSAQLWRMEQGQLDTYRAVYEKGCFGSVAHVGLWLWSWLRFGRRLIIATRFKLRA